MTLTWEGGHCHVLVPRNQVEVFMTAVALRMTMNHINVTGGQVDINLLSDLEPEEREFIDERHRRGEEQTELPDHLVEHLITDMDDELGSKKDMLLQAIYQVLLIFFDDPYNIGEPNMVALIDDHVTGTWATPLEGSGPAALRSLVRGILRSARELENAPDQHVWAGVHARVLPAEDLLILA